MEKKTDEKHNKQITKKHNFITILKKHRKKILLLFLLCIVIYIVYVVAKLIKNPTDTTYIEMGQIREEETAVGYIIREEDVVKGKN